MRAHPYARTERDLREVATGFSTGTVAPKDLPALLESIAANLRLVFEAEKAVNNEPSDYAGAMAAALAARARADAQR